MKGFTLIEVLVSLLILSIVTAAGLSSISFSTQNFIVLEDNFYNSTIAENILLLSYYDDNFLTNNITSQQEVLMGGTYIWEREIKIDKPKNAMSISVEVASELQSKPYKLEIFKTIK